MDDTSDFYSKFQADLQKVQDEVLDFGSKMGVGIFQVVSDNALGMRFSSEVFRRMKKLGYTQEQIHTYK